MKITKEQVLDNLEDVKKYIKEGEDKKEEKKVGIAIKTRLGSIIFKSSKTTIKKAIEEKSDANLRGADLSYADLSGANLRGADLSDADLSGANLSDADLSDANLSDADLSYADLSGANLSDADLSDADLSDADLSDADLSDANLSDANLRGAEMQNVKFYGKGGTKKLTKKQLPDFLNALGFQVE